MLPEPPFTEEVLHYDAEKFPFLPHVRRLLHIGFAADESGQDVVLPCLERLHDLESEYRFRFVESEDRFRRSCSDRSSKFMKRNGWIPKLAGPLVQDESFRDTYHRFIRDFLRPQLSEDFVVFESTPNLRIHAAGSRALTAPHKDEDHKHSRCELNFWLPLTAASGSASLWTESTPGRGDFHPFQAGYGEVVRFYGNQCLHFTRDNTTDTTRVSLDFRLVRFRDFARAGIPEDGSIEAAGRWALFRFYDIMGPDGLVSREDWPAVVAQAPRVPEVPESFDCGEMQAASGGSTLKQFTERRPRSSTPEHQQRCAEAFGGSMRAARRGCARCGWLAHRDSLKEALTYTNSVGAVQTWIAEAPDPFAPWGLGCILCHAAHAGRLGSLKAPCSPFTEFTFGTGAPQFFCNELLRHGNHGRHQQRIDSMVQRNDVHEAAAREAAKLPEPVLVPAPGTAG